MPLSGTLTLRFKLLLALLAATFVVAGVVWLVRDTEASLGKRLREGDLHAAERIAAMETYRAGEELADVARTGKPKPSAAAIIALARMKDFSPRDQVVLEAVEHTHPEARQAAAIGLRVIATPRARQDLRDPKYTSYVHKLLKDDSPEVRSSAATTLAQLDAYYSVPQLMDAIVAEDSPEALRAMKRALVKITHYKHFPFSSDKTKLRQELSSYLPDWRYSNAIRALDAKYKISTSTTRIAVPPDEIPISPDTP